MENKNPIITVIVINYNSGCYLADCLNALRQQKFKDFRVIVADNASKDCSFDNAKRLVEARDQNLGSRFQFFELSENFGFAKSNNLMMSHVHTPLVALLNPDAVPETGWLEKLVSAATSRLDVAMFGSTQIRLHDRLRYDGVGDNYLAVGVPWRGGYGHPIGDIQGTYEVFSPCAAAAVFRTDIFRAVGGFDESFFCYVEDVDIGFRLRLLGHKCLQVADAVVHHAGGVSSSGRHFAIFHGIRNMTWTFVKNMPAPLIFPLLPLHFLLLMVLLIRGVIRGDARPMMGGIFASVRGLPRCWSLRRNIQSSRVASLRDIACAMCWFPWYYLRRAPFALS